MDGKTLIAAGLVLCAPLNAAYARSAVVSNDDAGTVEFGLFNWESERGGEMVASFAITNKTDRAIKSLRIDCEYSVTAPGQPRSTRKISKLLEIIYGNYRPPDETILRARAGSHFPYITFGKIEPVEWVSNMTCRIGEVTY